MALKTDSGVVLFSSDAELEEGFDRVKRQALYWAFDDAPVGPYYEAALPNREAFCMRDVSHQCVGGEVLGLHRHNLNMFLKFAAAMSPQIDWCSYWEIDRYDRPCPVDYTDEKDFWYNLPANFDVADALYRMALWSGDKAYWEDEAICRFQANTMEAYVKQWDRDGDGVPDHRAEEGRRGVCSYDESGFVFRKMKAGTDLMAIQARGTLSCAAWHMLRGQSELSRIYQKRGEKQLEELYRRMYDNDRGFAEGIGFDDRPLFTDAEPVRALLYYRALRREDAARYAQKLYAGMEGLQIEEFSHVPEILWSYGLKKEAMAALRRLMDPALKRREYPEASYCAVGAAATGLMGICPDAPKGRIATLSGLYGTAWCKMCHVPVCKTRVSVRHDGDIRSELTNEGDQPVLWRARFPGEGAIENQESRTEELPPTGEKVTYADLLVGPGETAACVIHRG